MATQEPKTVAFVLYRGLTLLDLVGPLQVFASLRRFSDQYQPAVVAERIEPMPTDGPLTVTADYTFGDVPDPAVVIVPGGDAPTIKAMEVRGSEPLGGSGTNGTAAGRPSGTSGTPNPTVAGARPSVTAGCFLHRGSSVPGPVAPMPAPLVGCWSSPPWGEHGFRSTRNGRGRGTGRKKFIELLTTSNGVERTFFGPSTPDRPCARRNPPAESAGPRLGAGFQDAAREARGRSRSVAPRPAAD